MCRSARCADLGISSLPTAEGASASLSLRLAGALILLIAAGGTAVTFAAFAYGRQAAQQAYDRLLIGAANQIAGAVTLRDGAVVVDAVLLPGETDRRTEQLERPSDPPDADDDDVLGFAY